MQLSEILKKGRRTLQEGKPFSFCPEKDIKLSLSKVWPKNSIVFYCGKTIEKWNYLSLDKGIGASEIAVIKLSELWASKGYNVTVYTNTDFYLSPGGVNYLPCEQFDFQQKFDILIIWRMLECLYHVNVDARLCIVDLHDIIDKRQILPKVISNTDFFFVKSEYQKRMLPERCQEKTVVISNGGSVTKEEFNKIGKTVVRDPNYLIYASSYDRGLAFMLKWGWPKIKEACPNSYLKIYYGWNSFDALRGNDSETKLYKDTIINLMKQPGIQDCGRVSHSFLLKEKRKANIHWYTGNFQEIDCVTVRESASLGCIPIVSKYAEVFQEKPYCVCIEGDPKKRECQENAAEKIIEFLKDNEKAEKQRKETLKNNLETWEEISERWIKVFDR